MLSLLVFFPFLFALSLFLFPKNQLSLGALFGSLIQLIFSASLFFLFDPSSPNLQLKESFELIPFFGINYFLALDGLSFWYVLLSAFLLPLVILFSFNQKNPFYFFLLFTLVSLSNGAFLSFDGILFYIFFELSLLPLFFMIFIWGGEKRVYASFKFLLYTFFASLFLLGGFITMMLMNKLATGEVSFRLTDFYLLDFVFIQNSPLSAQTLLFFCFAFAFAVKTPLAPFHTWLPLAHVEAPTGASVYLAAVLLKMGTYGWFRFVIPLFPEASAYYAPLFLFLALFSLIYGSLVAFVQTDIKKLVAYSSVAHMAYVLLGLFSFNIYGLQGAFYQTLSHGISSAGLFLLVGLIYKRTGTRDIRLYGGLSKSMPYFSAGFFLICLSTIALPLTGGFISEFLVLMGSYISGGFWVYFAVLAVVLGAVYMLNVFQKMFLFKESKIVKNLRDLDTKEFLYLSPLVFLGFFMGIFPNIFFKYSKASLDHLSKNQYNYSLSFYSSEESNHKENLLEEAKSFSFLSNKFPAKSSYRIESFLEKVLPYLYKKNHSTHSRFENSCSIEKISELKKIGLRKKFSQKTKKLSLHRLNLKQQQRIIAYD